MTAKLKSAVAGALLATCLVTQNGDAGQVGPLTTFVSGTTARASDVNGNFSAVVTAVNDNDTRISALQTAPNVSGNITLVEPSTATAGNIMKGTASFIHDYGTRNTFVGIAAGNFTTQGSDNTAVGWNALTSNQGNGTEPGPGNNNAAFGSQALQSNTTGSANTASGSGALYSNTTGVFNTASGEAALFNNTTGSSNTASGVAALYSNTTGTQNTAAGQGALRMNTTGGNNTASGFQALFSATTGSNNIAIGYQAGYAVTTGSYNIEIGTAGFASDNRTLRIGSGDPTTGTQVTAIAGINGATVTGVPIYITSGSQLGIASSSRRVKDQIADMGEASSALMRLRPVTFYYKSDRNPKGRTLQYGLVAEEVAEIMPGLVAHAADGKPEAIYSQFLAPLLLNEVQKQQREIKRQSALLAKQSAEIAALRRNAERVAGVLDRLEAAGMLTAAR